MPSEQPVPQGQPEQPEQPGQPGQPAQRPAQPGSAAEAVFRRALRDVAVLLGVLLVVGLVAGGLAAKAPGVWGALIGWGLAAVFSTTTIVAMIRTVRSSPAAMAGVVMGTWLAKVLLVVVVLAVLRPLDFYSAPVLGGVLAVAVIGSALLDYRAVSLGRVPYVEPGGHDGSGSGART